MTQRLMPMVAKVRANRSGPGSWTRWFAARFHVRYREDEIGRPSCQVRRAQRVTSLSCHVQCVTIGPAKLSRISLRPCQSPYLLTGLPDAYLFRLLHSSFGGQGKYGLMSTIDARIQSLCLFSSRCLCVWVAISSTIENGNCSEHWYGPAKYIPAGSVGLKLETLVNRWRRDDQL